MEEESDMGWCDLEVDGTVYGVFKFTKLDNLPNYNITVYADTVCKMKLLLVAGGGRGGGQVGGGGGHVCQFNKIITGPTNLTITVGGSDENTTVSASQSREKLWEVAAGAGSDGREGRTGGCAGPEISPINIGGWKIHQGKSGRNDSKGAGGGGGIIVLNLWRILILSLLLLISAHNESFSSCVDNDQQYSGLSVAASIRYFSLPFNFSLQVFKTPSDNHK